MWEPHDQRYSATLVIFRNNILLILVADKTVDYDRLAIAPLSNRSAGLGLPHRPVDCVGDRAMTRHLRTDEYIESDQ